MPANLNGAEFVGEGRRGIAAGLLELFDHMQREQRPVWVSLEAPTGWGKTRIAQEFYSALARTRQTQPAYWPATIVSEHAQVSERRKIVNPPAFVHVPMSRPDYVWWGIACGVQNGTPTESLIQDVSVLRKHMDHLENAWWYRAGFVEKLASPAFSALREEVLEEGKTAIAEFGFTKAAELVGGALPGFSAMSWLVRKGVQQGKAAHARSRSLKSADEIVYQPSEVDEVESFLAKIAPMVPAVLFVEDVHDADDLLLELLERLVRRDVPVMILTTGWPGFIDASRGLSRAMRIAGDRLIRVDEQTKTLPSPFPPDATLRALETDDLASILYSYHEQVSPATRDALLTTFRNPFELELVLETYGDAESGVLDIDPADVEKLSAKVADLYKKAWERLDQPDRERLTLATLGIPAVISGDATDSRSWDRVMLETALTQLAQGEPDGHVGESAVDRAWVRIITEVLSQFHDVAQMNVAASEFIKESQRLRVRDALIDEAKRLIADGDTPADRSAQASRLLLAYGTELDAHDFVDATRALVDVLADLTGETGTIARLGEGAHSRLDLGNKRDRDLLWSFAQAQLELRHPERAIGLLEELLKVERELFAPDASEVVGTRRSIASALASDGRPQAAVDLLEEVLADQLSTLTETDAEVLDTRAQLALALADADRPHEAIRLNEDLLVTQAKTFGDDSLELINTRQRLATALTESGRASEALLVWEQVATELSAKFGPDNPATLDARSSLAGAVEDASGAVDAVAQYSALLADERRVLGPDHRNVLITRENLARSTRASGDHAEAQALYSTLIEDETRILDSDDPLLRARANLP
ncbi:tetratricopeptide repeat protein [Diaminobutyricibacter tongyongensis]|uniref:Tetratricopeptide repeat protein n=1 Tax=Leifsonia tongyongensis TaxID=1268043 RepID=A0A6L9XXG0_9MICO|nr:tetratricopeptide repeat protein [Diaminobutyricibacter tongyongensis]NEN05698.1 tetratricopeptide repeat protein [Diaminobutyricibacter tongyongensis]